MRKGKLFRTISETKGFTLAEILLAVAILIILSAVGVIGASSMIKNSRQKSADDAAETIALAFQNRLQEIYAFEYESRDMIKNGSVKAGNYYVIGEINEEACVGSDGALKKLTDDGNVIASDLYKNGFVLMYDPVNCRVISVTYSSDNSKYPVNTLYDNENVKADSATRKSNYGGNVGYYAIDEETFALLKSDSRNNINVRVGHYVNGERRLHNYDELIAYIEVKFPTSGKAFEDRLNGKYVRLDVKIQGKKSGNIVIYSLYGSYNNSISQINFPVILDGFERDKGVSDESAYSENNRFYNQFCDGTINSSEDFFSLLPAGINFTGNKAVNTNKNGEVGAYRLLAGEDIDVTVTVSSFQTLDTQGNTEDAPLLTVSATATDNSLFAYDNGLPETKENNKNLRTGLTGTTYNAYIAYGRHLQNLDESSGIAKAEVDGGIGATDIKAVQIQDIDFASAITGDTADSLRRKVLWCELPTKAPRTGVSASTYCFMPITNKIVSSFTGENANEADATKQHVIKNLCIDESDLSKSAVVGRTYSKTGTVLNDENYYAGLFRVFEGKELSNIVLIDPKIMGLMKTQADANGNIGNAGSVGALAGYVKNSSEVKITDCKVQISGIDANSEPTGWIMTAGEAASTP